MPRDILVFDIETVVDAESARRLLGHPEWDDATARNALSAYFLEKTQGNNDFPRQPFHQVVAIAYAHLIEERDGHGVQWMLRRIGSGGTIQSSEQELLEGFFHLIETRAPRLVSFNGRGFDIPVLKYRAMHYELSCPRWFSTGDRWNSYDSRYSSMYHMDVLEVLSDYGASARCSLDEVAAVFGVPGKLDTSGSDVQTLFEAGDIASIRDYCETDVCTTLLVFLRQQLFQGVLTQDAYTLLIKGIRNYLQSEEKAHFDMFLEAWG